VLSTYQSKFLIEVPTMNKSMRFIYGLLFGLTIMYFLTEVKNHCFLQSDSKTLLQNQIKTLVRQTARWTTASTQDESPLIAVLHADYGVGYLGALKDIASQDEIQATVDMDFTKFQSEVVAAQERAVFKALKTCPNYGPAETYISRFGGETL